MTSEQGSDGSLVNGTNSPEREGSTSELTSKEGQRLVEVLRAGRVLSYEWYPSSDVVVRSPNSEETFGEQATHLSANAVFNQIHPEDRERLLTLMRSLRPETPEYSTCYRYVRRTDGEELALENFGRGFFDSSGKLVCVRG